VTDVLIGAILLSHTQPGIVLNRLFTERELKRKIYVPVPERICIEPDASCEFTITETWHDAPEVWDDFFHLEVYRTLPPDKHRFKQKIQGYVTYVDTGQHQALFATPALSIAVFAQTPHMATTLKRWTEEALTDMARPEKGYGFSSGVLLSHKLARTSCFWCLSGSKRLALPKPRFLYLRRMHNGCDNRYAFTGMI
jgi:hypothetical protein